MKYQELIEQMTLEEKASLMSGADFWHTKAVARLSIPSMLMTDGPHGLRKQAGAADNLGLGTSLPATCYPTAAALANSWDEALLEELGAQLGLEAASQGVSILLGPGVNIKRNPLCGRNFEYFSEDPYLSGKAGAALIRGIQSQGISACVKHYAANSQELLRMSCNSVVDERTLREIYLPAFEMAVKEGDVHCLMSAYNPVNGQYANENMHLLRDILYGDWGYKGMVVSDWGGNNDRVAALKAGSSLEMPSSHGQTDSQIVAALKSGQLEESILNEQLDRLLDRVFSSSEHIQNKSCDTAAHHAFAAKAAEETAVLLKNEGGFLPLDTKRSVAVIGCFAQNPRYQGAGSSKVNPSRLENALDALGAEGLRIKGYAPGFKLSGKRSPRLIKQAVELAKSADVVLLYLGLAEEQEAEGLDRSHMRLPYNQIELIEAVARVNSSIAVILSCGSALETDWDVNVPALIHGYLGGQAGAVAMARLLTGRANPSGKLAESLPKRYEDVPSAPYFPGREASAQYREGLYVGYRYYESANVPVKYPFGHGLSYTKFEYSDISASPVRLSFTVKNVGSRPGAEVAQLYIVPPEGGIFRPAKELKGFARCFLQPGEERRISLELSRRSFALWSCLENDWVVEPGEYRLLVGASCQDIRLETKVRISGLPVKNPYTAPELSPYYTADIKNIPDNSFKALLGREPEPLYWDKTAPLGFNSALCQGEYLKGGVGHFIYRFLDVLCRSLKTLGMKELANTMAFIVNLPYRNIGRMSGMLNDSQVYALLDMVNRKKGGGRSFIRALIQD